MPRFLADEDFPKVVVRALRRASPDLDVVRVHDVDLISTHDAEILEWAALDDRVVVTHDVTTMTRFAYERVRDGKPMPGVVAVHQHTPLGRVIGDLLMIVNCLDDGELEGQVRYVPL